MLYHLFDYLNETYDLAGAGLFKFLSFRAAMVIITSLTISMFFGKSLINWIRNKQVGETIRDLGLEGQMEKAGTPTMGGIIILLAILAPTILFADLTNIYIQVMLVATVWFGAIGFVDDYIKVFKKNKQGLAGKFKIMGQVVGGTIIGIMLYISPDVTIKEKISDNPTPNIEQVIQQADGTQNPDVWKESKSFKTTIPFVKHNEFNYIWLINWFGDSAKDLLWLIFIPVVIIIVTAVSNGANMTDGLDGLATGTSAIIGLTLVIFAYVSGNYIFADYLNIMYIPHSGELVIFGAAFVGACIGFL